MLHHLIFSRSCFTVFFRNQSATSSTETREDGRAAIFLEMERLPEQHGVVVQALA